MADDEEQSKWLRECSNLEELLEIAHQNGFLISCYCLTMNSKKPLQEYHLQRALLHLLRKVPTLRVCLRERNGRLWFRRMEHEKVDFKTLKEPNLEEEFESVTSHHYDVFDGPLWCVRLLPWETLNDRPMLEVRDLFPNQYKILFGFHHSITDGYSNMKICNYFLNLLNDVISGKPINDYEQLAYHASDEATAREIKIVADELRANGEELKRIKRICEPKTDILLFKSFPRPPLIGIPKTLSIVESLNQSQTSKLIAAAQKHGVTFHSAFTTVVNTAIVDMLTKSGIKEKFYEISSYHLINYRQFWQDVPDSSNAFGCHFGGTNIMTKCGTNMAKDFWNYARQFHNQFQTSLKNKQFFKEIAATFMDKPPNASTGTTLNFFNIDPKLYYTITNMGNLESLLPGEGEHVQFTDIRRTTVTRGTICSHVLQTFRGRLIFGIDYDTSYMSTETARIYITTILKILLFLSSIG